MALFTADTLLKIGFDQRGYITGQTTTVSATTGGLAVPLVSQFTGNVTRLLMPAIVNSNYTNLQVGLMASNATGDLPSDTYLQTPNIQSGSANAVSTNYTITLTNPVAVTKGSVYWVVYKPNASFTGSIAIYHLQYQVVQQYGGYWRAASRSSSTWSRIATNGNHVIYGDNTNWYSTDNPVVPTNVTPITVAVNQQYGFAFTLNSNHPAIRVKAISFANAIHANATTGNPGMTFICNIYNAAGTLISTFDTQDTDRMSTNTTDGCAYFYNTTASDIWFEPNVKYYCMLAFTGTFTNTPTFKTYPYSNAQNMALGAYNANYATRSSGGVITETTTEFMNFHLEVDRIRFDNAGAGGGGYANSSPLFTGGFSG